jgi:hypothetical protein
VLGNDSGEPWNLIRASVACRVIPSGLQFRKTWMIASVAHKGMPQQS